MGCCTPRLGWDHVWGRGVGGMLIPVLIPVLIPGKERMRAAVAQPCPRWDLPAGGN